MKIKPEKEVIPEYYKTEYKKSQVKIDSLQTKVRNQKNQINILKYEIDLIDSTVFNADKQQLDSLFNDFFREAR